MISNKASSFVYSYNSELTTDFKKKTMILKSLQTTIFESNLAVQNIWYLVVALHSFNAKLKNWNRYDRNKFENEVMNVITSKDG